MVEDGTAYTLNDWSKEDWTFQEETLVLTSGTTAGLFCHGLTNLTCSNFWVRFTTSGAGVGWGEVGCRGEIQLP